MIFAIFSILLGCLFYFIVGVFLTLISGVIKWIRKEHKGKNNVWE